MFWNIVFGSGGRFLATDSYPAFSPSSACWRDLSPSSIASAIVIGYSVKLLSSGNGTKSGAKHYESLADDLSFELTSFALTRFPEVWVDRLGCLPKALATGKDSSDSISSLTSPCPCNCTGLTSRRSELSRSFWLSSTSWWIKDDGRFVWYFWTVFLAASL